MNTKTKAAEPAKSDAKSEADAPATGEAAAPKAKGRKKADPNETRAGRFVRIQTMRLKTAVKALRALGKPETLATMDYTPKHIDACVTVLRGEIDALQKSLEVNMNRDPKSTDEFSFSFE